MKEEKMDVKDELKKLIKSTSFSEEEMHSEYIEMMWTLVNFIEIKDAYTAGHSRSVTSYSESIGKKLIYDKKINLELERLIVASMLHDLGKVCIDNSILNKPSRLTNEEYEIIKTHSIKGFNALKHIDKLQEERMMIKYHHERFDGMGYPEGKIGEAIPLGSRIICVADAFDAMTSDRPYRKAMTVEKAVDELKTNKGSQFDPEIVDTFLSILEEHKYDINKLNTLN